MEIGFENAVHQLKKKLVEKFSSTYETQIIFSLLISNLIFNKVALSNVANAETSPITFFFFHFYIPSVPFASTSFPVVRRANHLATDFHLSVITCEKGEGSANAKKKNYYFQNNYVWCLEFI